MLPACLQSLASADMEDLGLHSCTSPGPCKEASDGPEFPAFLRQYVEVQACMALHRVQFEAVCVEVRWHTCSPAWPCAQHAWPMHFKGS